MKICTVIGFPNGYSTTEVKVFETEDAIRNGADEIDMVANIGWIKEKRWADLEQEIRAVKASCQGRILKVIIETCLLTDEEKIEMCRVVTTAGADYIKTSTGFSTDGATREDVALFKAHVGPGVKIKGGRRHLVSSGRGGFYLFGRGSPGYIPHCEAGKGGRGRGILSRTQKNTKQGEGYERWEPDRIIYCNSLL